MPEAVYLCPQLTLLDRRNPNQSPVAQRGDAKRSHLQVTSHSFNLYDSESNPDRHNGKIERYQDPHDDYAQDWRHTALDTQEDREEAYRQVEMLSEKCQLQVLTNEQLKNQISVLKDLVDQRVPSAKQLLSLGGALETMARNTIQIHEVLKTENAALSDQVSILTTQNNRLRTDIIDLSHQVMHHQRANERAAGGDLKRDQVKVRKQRDKPRDKLARYLQKNEENSGDWMTRKEQAAAIETESNNAYNAYEKVKTRSRQAPQRYGQIG